MTKCPYDKTGYTDCPDTSKCAYCRMENNPHYLEGRPGECRFIIAELEKSIRERNAARALWYLQRLKKLDTNDTEDIKMTLKTEKNKIWYSQAKSIAVVVGDWELHAGDEIPHDDNEAIRCILLIGVEWCPLGKFAVLDVDGTAITPVHLLKLANDCVNELDEDDKREINKHHAYLVEGLQPDEYIVDPRVIAKMW